MRSNDDRWNNDRWMDAAIGHLLRAGVLLAAAIVLIGAVMFLRQHGSSQPTYGQFRSEPAELRSVSGVAHAAAAGVSTAIIQLGLVLLIATPIVRVAFSVVVFLIERDRLYVVITLIVLAVLIYGIL